MQRSVCPLLVPAPRFCSRIRHLIIYLAWYLFPLSVCLCLLSTIANTCVCISCVHSCLYNLVKCLLFFFSIFSSDIQVCEDKFNFLYCLVHYTICLPGADCLVSHLGWVLVLGWLSTGSDNAEDVWIRRC